ncbi:hypothetical protein BDB00DRAFT_936020 [Zychaea mexicana]|uniref:uncharacterized protein n=1 Tax=Zychaea mexicana TaxID=64656 RepID=UPI0022FE3836|nr:uncharacterized protein BDB00DRAFT_936020 [Zychaea mexicana]KAI9498002.1 hypothetical protein BDB00DRAFT_936020 [Zychaea mexicana]
MSSVPPSPTVVMGDERGNNPYQHQGAYAIRPRQPSLQQQHPQPQPPSPVPITIPENIKKSYMRQQLPVRKQSLAAAATAAKAVNAFYTHSKTTRHPSNASDESNNDPTTPPPMYSPPSFFAGKNNKRRDEKHVSFGPAPIVVHSSSESLPPFSEEEEEEVDDELVLHAKADTSGYDGLHNADEDDDDDEDNEEEEEETEALVAQQLDPPQQQHQLAVVSPMAYDTEDQQNAFFSHYVQPGSKGRRGNHSNNNTALLSYVALEMYKRIVPDDVLRDGVEYHYLFTGKEAVDQIVDISQGADRNRALMIGRTLESLDVFHGIDGERRFMDASSELYRFTAFTIDRAKDGSTNLATGVFTPQTPCYSPTCTTDRPCYSNCCPKVKRRIKRTRSQYARPDKRTSRALWVHSVPKAVIAATPPEEQKRQECIYELIYTEEEFARDLEYINNHWIKPLSASDIISGSDKRNQLVQQIFWNIAEIEKVSAALSSALVQRRKEQEVIDMIGDVMMAFVYQFEPYVAYGSHQVIGKHHFELEKRRNPKFAQFVRTTERKKESRRLELNGYLTKPTTRLGRYNLLLREILKRTPQGNPDREIIPQATDAIAKLLERVNEETGRIEQLFTLQQIEERMAFKSTSIYVDLKLRDAERELVMQGKLKRKGHGSSEDLQVFLFDHYLVFGKIKNHNHVEHFKISRKPIPLDVLSLSIVDIPSNGKSRPTTPSSLTTPSPSINSNSCSSNSSNSIASPRPSTSSETSTPLSLKPVLSSSSSSSTASNNGVVGIIFYHHGRNGSPPMTLYTNSMATRDLWVEKILTQKEKLMQKQQEAVMPLTKQASNSSSSSSTTTGSSGNSSTNNTNTTSTTTTTTTITPAPTLVINTT